MDPFRALVYDFLQLPYSTRINILRSVNLITLEEQRSETIKETELWQMAFRRAREQNLIDALTAEVAKETAKLSE